MQEGAPGVHMPWAWPLGRDGPLTRARRLSAAFPTHSFGAAGAEAVPLAGEEPEPQEVERSV